jgi:rSAM/selenodomain-associated transferase 1
MRTPLTPALPPELALALEESVLADTLETVAGLDTQHHVFWEGDATEGVPAVGFREHRQGKGELGTRLERAFETLLAHRGERAVIVEADCPEITARQLERALVALAAKDLVVGPTHDGGTYLVGLSRRAPAIFRGVGWGTGQALAQTLERAQGVGLSWDVLPALARMDTPSDLASLLARWLVRVEDRTPHTAAVLARNGLLPALG